MLAFSHGLLKWVATREASNYMETLEKYWLFIGISISVYFFIFLYYAYILRTISISYLYPVYTGLSIVFVAAVGVFGFEESFGSKQAAGVLFILVGVYLTTSVGDIH